MEGNWFNFKNRHVYLEADEIFQVHEYYVVQRNANYLRDNYPQLTEEKIMEMAWDWRYKELQDGYSNEDALKELLEENRLNEEDDSEPWFCDYDMEEPWDYEERNYQKLYHSED